MTQKEEITKCLAEYAWNICTVQRFYMGDSIPAKALKNAIKTYATGVSESDVIALLDETITANGKEGYLFTDTMAYYKDSGKQGEFVYKDIKGVEVEDEDEDPKTSLYIYTKDGEEYEWRSRLMNKVPVYNFFKDVMAYFKEEKKKQEEKIIKSTVSDDAEKQVSDLLARLTK
jgi:hypothetical protein